MLRHTGITFAGAPIWLLRWSAGHVHCLDGFTNAGNIKLEGTPNGPSTLAVTDGTLINAPDGVITINPASGGDRTDRCGNWIIGAL